MEEIRMKRFTSVLLLLVASFCLCSNAGAATVGVWGDRYDLNNINNFYNTLAGHDSHIITGSLDLTGVNLLWAVQPADSYTAEEITIMHNFLNTGGRIAFMGEHGGYAPDENNRITAALAQLGSHMSIVNLAPDGGFHDATVANGQILSHPLTEGVNTYNYACFAPLTLGAGSTALMLGSNLSDVMMGYENVGPGSIFLITDQNVWDNVYLSSNDNKRMFENLLVGNTQAVPVPAALWLLGSGLFGLIGLRKKFNS
jgi:hypothetical protein